MLSSIAICLVACNQNAEVGSAASEPSTAVTLTRVSYGNIRNDMVLSATTAYLNKSVVAAPIAGYVVKVHVRTGDRVKAGQPLFDLESKEQHALASPGMRPITIRAGEDGVVLDVRQQADNYAAEGTALCSLAEENSFVFLLNVPYEQSAHAVAGKACTLVLPDDTRLAATIGRALAVMNAESQSRPVMAYADAPFLPEGMSVKALLPVDETAEQMMILPKRAVQSDETLTGHWVMKLLNDSTAVKVPVEIGDSNADSVEVRGDLTPDDRIVLTGGYALADSSRIVIHEE